ncbi:MAG: hypothetical protein J6U54_07955 [Clostridiales bacterium]|nr:hypothetical protein [Clostridiales bacterium]
MKNYVKKAMWFITNGDEEISDIIVISGVISIILDVLMRNLRGIETIEQWMICFRIHSVIYAIFLFALWLRVANNMIQWLNETVGDDEEFEEES